MLSFLAELKNFLVSLVNNENYLNLISMAVVALTSYNIAKYNASKPNKIKVKQLQLANVYLPLFRLFENTPITPGKLEALTICRKATNVLDKNYELVFPQLHKLNKSLRDALASDQDYTKTLKTMKHQVDTDYELLKKALGYPSESVYSIFVRMTTKQKWDFLFPLIGILAYVLPCLAMFPLMGWYGNIIGLVVFFVFFTATHLATGIIRNIVKKMDN